MHLLQKLDTESQIYNKNNPWQYLFPNDKSNNLNIEKTPEVGKFNQQK